MNDVAWRKSTYSSAEGGNCVEVAARASSPATDPAWRKSTHSDGQGGNCVEVASAAAVLVRDTTDRAGLTLAVPASAWRTFTGTIRASSPRAAAPRHPLWPPSPFAPQF
jgi:hypothetical protein